MGKEKWIFYQKLQYYIFFVKNANEIRLTKE